MANKRQGGLGRGLAALIPTDQPNLSPRLGDRAADILMGEESASPSGPYLTREKPAAPKNKNAARTAAATAAKKEKNRPVGAVYRDIPIESIRPNEKQPRTVFDDEHHKELVHSISAFGLLQPIVVREVAPESYELIMGERRWRAATAAGLQKIPAIVRKTEDSAMLRDALLENIHRVQLNPLEEAAAYQQLLEEFEVTHEELADKLGRSRPVISNMIRLLKLPVAVQRRVAAGVLSAGHARALLSVKVGEAAQEALASRIVAEGLSVRQTEEAVALLNNGDSAPSTKRLSEKPVVPSHLTDRANWLSDTLDTTVKVQMGRRKGRIVIDFGNEEDAQRILSILAPNKQ